MFNSTDTILKLALAGLAVSCASTPGARPDDMSAEEHRAAAAAQEEEAAKHQAQYDPEATAEAISPEAAAYPGQTISTTTYNPTAKHLEHAKQYREHAADHEAAAAALDKFEEQECKRLPVETRHTCPLLGNIVSVEDLDNAAPVGPGRRAGKRGVRVKFADGVDINAVIAHMRCHIAFARTQGHKGMDHCPLYIEGISLKSSTEAPAEGAAVRGQGGVQSGKGAADVGTFGPGRGAKLHVDKGPDPQTVDLLVDDDSLLEELRRRARAHLPGAHSKGP